MDRVRITVEVAAPAHYDVESKQTDGLFRVAYSVEWSFPALPAGLLDDETPLVVPVAFQQVANLAEWGDT